MNHEVLITATSLYYGKINQDSEIDESVIPGVYRVRFQSDTEDKETLVDEALDIFHNSISLDENDDIELSYEIIIKTAHQRLSEADFYDSGVEEIKKIR